MQMMKLERLSWLKIKSDSENIILKTVNLSWILTIRTYASNSFSEPLKTQSKPKSALQFLFVACGSYQKTTEDRCITLQYSTGFNPVITLKMSLI